MWKISNLKNRGKTAFKRNYWKCVLVSLLFMMVVGGVGLGASSSNTINLNTDSDTNSSSSDYSSEFKYTPGDRFEYEYDFDNGEIYFDDETGAFGYSYEDSSDDILDSVVSSSGLGALLAVSLGVLFLVLIVTLIIAILLDMFIFLPFEVGTRRFFFLNQKENAEVKEIAYAYDHGWKNIGITLFFRDLYTFLWSLLLIIPGIVKMYEYRMMPYILAENPDMPKEEVFALSKKMMKGEKWHAFVMDLSFIGWHLLGLITLGIVEVFYTLPYQNSTNATLYEALKYLKIDHPQEFAEQPNENASYTAETQTSESSSSTAETQTSETVEPTTTETTDGVGTTTLDDEKFDE